MPANDHPETPQQSVLRTEDLVHNILEYFAVDPRADWSAFPKYHEDLIASRKQLYNAALISRCFVHPALELLWRTIDSMMPLIKLLPESLLSQDNGQYMVIFTHNHGIRSI
ncbi:hypothetical protein BDN72DRAFT_441648 [Pluteus cervinus]|uniref:Uncharacterized protein n=1 Tax=Pluteus cervinus TaxID=181527 RepID=A0ACD3BCZ0_9AGAR|nr:hypothetical protein BDN72DRAFT_441648 [Pluteus cervinus]